MKKIILIFFIFLAEIQLGYSQNRSLTYAEVISKYKEMDSLFEEAKLITYGRTDCGEPLHLFVITNTKIHNPSRLHELNKCVLFINNGIHPGEPDGVDASTILATDLLTKPLYKRMLDNVVVCIVPVFNIDGALERNKSNRVNQNGPDEPGFRANAKNLDLNRDFIKADASNTISLITILRQWDPDVFIDTHVSDGADYQYTMTLISSQHNKLNPVLGSFMKNKFTPSLFNKMNSRNDEMIPYVQSVEGQEIPDSGIVAFLETPRYLSGYMSLFNCFPFISESHMLKPYNQRVKSTLNLLFSLTELCDEQFVKIIELRKSAYEEDQKTKTYFFNYKLDFTKNELIEFKGYEAVYKPSKVTGSMRLYYDFDQPYKKKITFYNEYSPSDSVKIPKYYIIPQAWSNIISLLKINGVTMIRNDQDTSANCETLYITDYNTLKEPFEGHYLHYEIKTRSEIQKIRIRKGDYLVPLPQKNMRYALETLNPRAVDSYFSWGFFDSFLQQKEWFSPFLFEDTAASILERDAALKIKFDAWKKNNPTADDFSQLNYIYQNSSYYEKTFRRYPVFSYY